MPENKGINDPTSNEVEHNFLTPQESEETDVIEDFNKDPKNVSSNVSTSGKFFSKNVKNEILSKILI